LFPIAPLASGWNTLLSGEDTEEESEDSEDIADPVELCAGLVLAAALASGKLAGRE
jgi:hypothetical protein